MTNNSAFTFSLTPEGMLVGADGSIPVKSVQQVRLKKGLRKAGQAADTLLMGIGMCLIGGGAICFVIGAARLATKVDGGEPFVAGGLAGFAAGFVCFAVGTRIAKATDLFAVEAVPTTGSPVLLTEYMSEPAAKSFLYFMTRVLASDLTPGSIKRIGDECAALATSGHFSK